MTYPVFDLHCDTADRLAWQTLPADIKAITGIDAYGPGDAEDPAGIRSIARNRGHISLEKIGGTPWAQCFACYIPDQLMPERAQGFYRHVVDDLAAQAAANSSQFRLVSHAADIRPTLEQGLVAGIRTIENARMLGFDPSLARILARDGVLMASLSWNARGPLASGHDTSEHMSHTGIRVIAELEAAGIILDVSHLNDECFSDVVDHAEKPFVASHSNSRAVCSAPRNLTDAQFVEIRNRGGLVGLNFADIFLANGAPAVRPTFDDISRHLDHWLELDGENVIALGSDFDGCDTPDVVADAARIPAFQELLAQRFGEDLTRKLCAENALAFFERWGN